MALPTSRILTLEEILAADDLGRKVVEVPEWGGSVVVRRMTKEEERIVRSTATDLATGQVDVPRLELLMVVLCMAEPKLNEEQVEQLLQKSAAGYNRVLQAITEVAGYSREVRTSVERAFPTGLS